MTGDTTLTYSVKIVNPSKRGEYEVHKLRGGGKIFSSVIEVKGHEVFRMIRYVHENIHFTCGYIESSWQGMRGKHRWLHVNEDLQDMYKEYEKAEKHEVLLWCDGRSDESGKSKRKCASTNDCNSPDKKSSDKR